MFQLPRETQGQCMYRCRKCHRKHHTSLCTESDSDKQDTNDAPPTTTNTATPSSSASKKPVQSSGHYHVASSDLCLLKTAVATVSFSGTCVDAHILFDEGSQRPFVSRGLADCLQLKPHKYETLSISTFGTQSNSTSQLESAVIQLHTISGQLIPLTVLIVPNIAAPIPNVKQSSLANLSHLSGLPCLVFRAVHYILTYWSRPLLGDSRGPHCKRQWSNGNEIQAWLSPLWTNKDIQYTRHINCLPCECAISS